MKVMTKSNVGDVPRTVHKGLKRRPEERSKPYLQQNC